jgi:dolichyl-diphosphooligosaccharide--protein glycosyltransferase
LLVGWASVVCLLTLLQKRFANTSSVAIAMLLALTLRESFEWALRHWPSKQGAPRRGSVLVGGTLALIVLGLIQPSLDFFVPLASQLWRGEHRVLLSGASYDWYAMSETAAWMQRNTPRTPGWLDSSRAPGYGVVAPWDMGHIIGYVGRRPTSSTNFGDDIGATNFLLVQEYYASDEDRAVEILDRLHGRYVVVPYYQSFLREPPGEDAMYHALYTRSGSEQVAIERGPGAERPALTRHRLVYEHPPAPRSGSERGPFMVYERVAGARIVGRAAPGTEIRSSLTIYKEHYTQLTYRTRAVAGDDGLYELRVPYANPEEDDTRSRAVAPASHYELECDLGYARAQVREIDVRRGRRVRGPDLCPS